MPTTVQFRRGTTSQNDSFTGSAGELSVDTTLDQLRVHDGATVGGFKVGRGVDVDDRMQVANTNTLVSDRMQVANTNTLVSDRMQVANAVSKTSTTDQSMKATLAVDSEGASSGVHIANGAISIYSATGSPSYVDFYCEVTNAHYTRFQAAAHADYTGNVTLTSPTTSGTLGLDADIKDRMQVANTNTLVSDRMQVANTQALHSSVTANLNSYIANTNPRISNLLTSVSGTNTAIRALVTTESGRIDNVLTSISGTNTSIRTLVSDRMQVANTIALANARLGAAATVALTGDVTASATAFSSNAVSISTTIASNSVDGSKLTDNIVIAENLVVSGNLTVSGTQTTVNSNEVNIGDAIITLNSDLGGGVAASEDAGITINRGSDADVSFIYDESEDRWSLGSQQLVSGDLIPNSDSAEDLGTNTVRWRKLFTDAIDITNDVDVGGNLTVTGSINATVEGQANTAAALSTARAIQLGGDLSGSANFDGTSDITITATIQNNSVALGTDTTGDYIESLTVGTGLDTTTATGEGSTPNITLDLSELSTSTTDGDGDFFVVVDASNVQRKLTKGNIAISGFNNDAGYSTTTGTVTSVGVTAGTGLSGGGTVTSSGTISLALDMSELTDMTATMIGTDEFIVLDGGADRRKAANEIGLSIFNNDAGFSTTTGTVTSHTVSAGNGLTGGGTVTSSGTTTLNVGAGTGISVSADAVALATAGAGAGTYGSTTNGTKIDTITLDAYGRVTAVATGGTGDIDGVTAGDGLTGGGTSGTVTLNVGAGTGVTVAADTVSIGQAVGTGDSVTFAGVNINGNLNAVDDIYLADQIFHEGDTDTYMQFHAANQWRVVTGGTEMLEVNDSYILCGSNVVGSVHTDTSNSGTVTPNFHVYNSFVWTLTGNVTLGNPTTEVAGQSGVFVFIQDGTGSRTLSLSSDYETAGGAGLTLSTAASAVDIVPYFVQSSGNILLGAPQLAFS